MEEFTVTPTDWERPEDVNIIKVIGVGGGGCNAVNYMFNKKMSGCTFIVCNTDRQALNKCDVPIKIQLGEGLGAGTNPTEGRNAALNSQKEIEEKVFDEHTEMLFITAGMGGGTGTGAAPVIAAMAKKKGILTVGVVTIPFKNLGNEAMARALDGISEIEKNVDSLLIIDNEKLFEVHGDLLLEDAFPKADEVLATAVKGITDIIRSDGYINVDFKDVKAMMKNSGHALMGCGIGRGENRIDDAVRNALESPLLNDFDLKVAKDFLINITVGRNGKGLTMAQYGEISKKIKSYTGKANNFKTGIVFDDDPLVEDEISITVIVTGIKTTIIEPGDDLGNVIAISSDFVHTRKERSICNMEEEEESIQKIGYNNVAIRKKGLFADGVKPALLVDEGENKGWLENTAAIRRKAHGNAGGNE